MLVNSMHVLDLCLLSMIFIPSSSVTLSVILYPATSPPFQPLNHSVLQPEWNLHALDSKELTLPKERSGFCPKLLGGDL